MTRQLQSLDKFIGVIFAHFTKQFWDDTKILIDFIKHCTYLFITWSRWNSQQKQQNCKTAESNNYMNNAFN